MLRHILEYYMQSSCFDVASQKYNPRTCCCIFQSEWLYQNFIHHEISHQNAFQQNILLDCFQQNIFSQNICFIHSYLSSCFSVSIANSTLQLVASHLLFSNIRLASSHNLENTGWSLGTDKKKLQDILQKREVASLTSFEHFYLCWTIFLIYLGIS